MKHRFKFGVAAVMVGLAMPASMALGAATAPAVATSEDARLTAFLDAEFAEWVKQQPQLATRLGIKEGGDRWNDISDKAAAEQLAWRQASVARMQAQFDRAKLSAEAQVNYDIWALEADRAALAQAYRIYRPPFYSFLYSAHSQLPDFLVNTHAIADTTDLKNYIARLRALPAVLDTAIVRSEASDAAGIRAPKFQIERIIAGSQTVITGAPFGPGPDSPLWADHTVPESDDPRASTATLETKSSSLPRAESASMETIRMTVARSPHCKARLFTRP